MCVKRGKNAKYFDFSSLSLLVSVGLFYISDFFLPAHLSLLKFIHNNFKLVLLLLSLLEPLLSRICACIYHVGCRGQIRSFKLQLVVKL